MPLFIFAGSTSWHTQPYTRGAYTAMAVGASQLDIEHIAQPLYSNSQQKKVSCKFLIYGTIVVVHLGHS